VKWRDVICTRRGQKVWIREKALSVDWNGWPEQDVIYPDNQKYM